MHCDAVKLTRSRLHSIINKIILMYKNVIKCIPICVCKYIHCFMSSLRMASKSRNTSLQILKLKKFC